MGLKDPSLGPASLACYLGLKSSRAVGRRHVSQRPAVWHDRVGQL